MKVKDPFGVASDPEMPSLLLALDPDRAKDELKRGLPRLTGENGICRLKGIRVTRYKPGRRCVIEYKVIVEKPGASPEEVILIGKVRARRFGNEGYRLLDEFWRAGFETEASDGISVPEPIGVLPEFKIWFQRKIIGEVSSNCFSRTDGIELAKRIAEAAVEIHRAKIPTDKRHTMADELRILRDCLKIVAEEKPEWTNRIEKVFQGCERLGLGLPQPKLCGIHRDFYSDQVIVTPDSRLFILDFDLYCLGDPALDIGNFIGHLTEQSLRMQNRFDAFSEAEKTLEETFVGLAGEGTRPAVHVYTTLTLARHIFLSTKFEERRPLTEALLQHCEERLAQSGKI